jgi:hypothetical protein
MASWCWSSRSNSPHHRSQTWKVQETFPEARIQKIVWWSWRAVDGGGSVEDRSKGSEFAEQRWWKGYPKDHPDIELLKLKSYRIVSPTLKDSEVMSEGFLDLCAGIFGDMVEFIDMLNDVVMPDDSDEDGDEEEGEEEEDDE